MTNEELLDAYDDCQAHQSDALRNNVDLPDSEYDKADDLRAEILSRMGQPAGTPPQCPKCKSLNFSVSMMGRNNQIGTCGACDCNAPVTQFFAPPATPQVEALAAELLDVMETCHVCKGALLLQESPVHCENCSGDCENHEGPECTPIYVLHAKLRKALRDGKHLVGAPPERIPEGK